MAQEGVRFVRMNGRVVPIKSKKGAPRKSERRGPVNSVARGAVKGAAYMGAAGAISGATVAAIGGRGGFKSRAAAVGLTAGVTAVGWAGTGLGLGAIVGGAGYLARKKKNK